VPDPRAQASGPSPLTRALRDVAERLEHLTPRADLDERDSDYIREKLPIMWLFASIYYRGEVRSLGNIPDPGAAACSSWNGWPNTSSCASAPPPGAWARGRRRRALAA
jgi:hypothetical protein